MTVPPDLPPDLPPEDVALLLAAVDGTLDDAQATRLLADPVLQREVDEHRAVRDALARAVTPLPGAVRDRLLAAALDAADETGPATTPTPVVPLRPRRRPLARAGAVAAAAAATLAVAGGLSLLGGPGGLDTASDVPTTAAVALAAEAERAAGIASTEAGAAPAPDAAGKDAGTGPAPGAIDAATTTDAAAPTRLPAPLADLDGLRAATRDLLSTPPAGAGRCTPAAGTTRGVVLGTWQGTEVEILFVADAPGAPVTSLEVRDDACTLLASLPVG